MEVELLFWPSTYFRVFKGQHLSPSDIAISRNDMVHDMNSTELTWVLHAVLWIASHLRSGSGWRTEKVAAESADLRSSSDGCRSAEVVLVAEIFLRAECSLWSNVLAGGLYRRTVCFEKQAVFVSRVHERAHCKASLKVEVRRLL